jgi:hypothetical protein
MHIPQRLKGDKMTGNTSRPPTRRSRTREKVSDAGPDRNEKPVFREGLNNPNSVWSDALADRIIQAFKMGAKPVNAASYNGIGKSTLYDWLNRTDEPFVTFQRQVEQARETYRLFLVTQIREHVPKDWRAAAFLLERHDPSWRLSTKVEHSTAPERPLEIAAVRANLEALSDEELEFLAAIQKKLYPDADDLQSLAITSGRDVFGHALRRPEQHS